MMWCHQNLFGRLRHAIEAESEAAGRLLSSGDLSNAVRSVCNPTHEAAGLMINATFH